MSTDNTSYYQVDKFNGYYYEIHKFSGVTAEEWRLIANYLLKEYGPPRPWWHVMRWPW